MILLVLAINNELILIIIFVSRSDYLFKVQGGEEGSFGGVGIVGCTVCSREEKTRVALILILILFSTSNGNNEEMRSNRIVLRRVSIFIFNYFIPFFYYCNTGTFFFFMPKAC